MNPPETHSGFRRRTTGLFVMLLWLAAMVLAALLRATFGLKALKYAPEAALSVLVMGPFFMLRPCRHFLEGLSLPRLCIGAAFFLFMASGHLANLPERSFPFVRWKMYVRHDPSETYWTLRLEGRGPGRDAVILNPERLFPSLGGGYLRFSIRLRETAERGYLAGGKDGPAGAAARREFEDTVRAVARAYNRRRGTEAITVIAAARDIHDTRGKLLESKTIVEIAARRAGEP